MNLSGCLVGQFFYSGLSAPVVLSANASYYLASQETAGGDQWFDHAAISTTADAAAISSLYSVDSSNWLPLGGGNASYVPPNFLYSTTLPGSISVTVQSNPPGASFTVDGTTYSASQSFNWTAGSAHSLTATSPQAAGTGAQYLWSNWSDGGTISHTVAPSIGTTFTANFTTQYLLNATVSPPGSGSVSTNPTSVGGYFASGTPVQMTATPGVGCTFSAWTGDQTGTANPLPITMSAAANVTANFQCSGPVATPFVTGFALSSPVLRNNFSGWVGMKFTVGPNPLSVSALGRIFIAGNTGTHVVKFVRASDGTDVPGGSV